MKHGYGSIRESHGAWQLRYYIEETGPDGKPHRRQVAKILARKSEQYPTAKAVQPLADDILAPLRRNAAVAESSLTLSEFNERYFLPFVKAKKRPSTVKFYKEGFDNHVKDRAGFVRLRDFTTRHAQEVLDAVPLSHQSLLRIKTIMSAIFSHAIRLGFIHGANPVRESKAEGDSSEFEGYAYSLDEILYMLRKLKEPARTVCAVAAFSGLRESEIRGLQWPDYTGRELFVRRSLWRGHIGKTKTKESRSSVPVIAPLRKILDQHKERVRHNGSAPWIFAGLKKGFSLHLDNLCRREIRPLLEGRWHGWHAFRRGLATNLFNLGVPAETVQKILRHSDVETTRKHYILIESRREGVAAMRKLEKALANKEQSRSNRSLRKSRSTA